MLPLVPEPTTVPRREDLTQVDPLSDPTDTNSTKVKFAFKILRRGNGKIARDAIQWFINVERAFAGLISNNGQLRYQMLQQFACGSALSGFNHNVPVQAAPAEAELVATAQAAMNRDNGTNVMSAVRCEHCSVSGELHQSADSHVCTNGSGFSV